MNKRPLLIVISSPSGGGKTTLGKMLLKGFRGMRRSVSCTTRMKRRGEINGRDYIFLTKDQFLQKLKRDFFLEAASVHGHWYGTPRQPVMDALRKGHDILLIIDVQGAQRVRQYVKKAKNAALKSAFLDIFIMPPGIGELRRRLMKRGEDSMRDINLRLKNAAAEMRARKNFRHVVVNDVLKKAYAELRAIMVAEHCKHR
jgi:guanylate kinase